MTKRNSRIALAAVLLACTVLVWAGDKPKKKELAPYALLFGTVYGPDMRSAVGVPIKIRRDGEKKAKWELVSNSTGEFAQRLPAGAADYVVWADLRDKKAAERSAVKVHFEKDERQDVVLHLTQEKK